LYCIIDSVKRNVITGIKRFEQDPNFCGVATCASLGNFYNSEVTYETAKQFADSSVATEGIFTPEQGLLLNDLGFKTVTIVTADLNIFDFSWQKRSKKWKISRLKRLKKYLTRLGHEETCSLITSYIAFLENSATNNVIIDWEFPKYIKKLIRRNIPVGASFNWTSFYRAKKETQNGNHDIRGRDVEHAFVIRGYSNSHIYCIDSNEGLYKMKWPDFLLNINRGDLIFIGDLKK